MPQRWHAEACDLHADPHSGAAITRLTSGPLNNVNIYCEQPYTDPGGKRVAYQRSATSDPRVPPYDLCVADLDTLKVATLDTDVAGNWIGTSSWTGQIYYLRQNGELVCVDLATLEKRIVITYWELPPSFHLDTVSPDHRYLVGVLRQPGYTCALIRVDLETGDWEQIFEHNETLSHVQFNPVHGRQILVQLNRGMRIDNFNRKQYFEPEHRGATHFVIDADGSNLRPLPVGNPHTAGSTGHSGWVGDTGRVGLPVGTRLPLVTPEFVNSGDLHDPRHPQGNFVTVHPDEESPRVFSAPEHMFNHVNISRCGRYFVSDSYRNGVPGAIELVVGNIETGKYDVLVSDCGAQGGGPACGHPHAYFTADNRHVIYNANPFGQCNVHKAEVPEGFLEALD